MLKKGSTSEFGDVEWPNRRGQSIVRSLMAVCIIFIAAIFPSLILLLLSLIFKFTDASLDKYGTILRPVMSIATLVIAVILLRLMMRYADRQPMRNMGLLYSKSSLRLFALGIFISCCIIISVKFLFHRMGWIAVEKPVSISEYLHNLPQILALAFFLQGIPEELIFRGYIMQTLRRPLRALLISTLLFTVIHLISSGGQQNITERFLYLFMPLGFGFLAGVLTLYTRSI